MDRRKFRSFKSAHALASKPLLATLLATAIISGCGANNANQPPVDTKPAWITSMPSSSYMIYGVGNAQNTGDLQQAKLAAQEAARLALAKQLNVTISATTRIEQSATEKSMQFHVDELINSKVPDIHLQGVKIEDEYVSADRQTVFALAAFNRTEAAMQTELAIRALDGDIAQFRLAATGSKSQQLKQAAALKELLVKRSKQNRYLTQLQAAPLALPEAVRDKQAEADAIINDISFSIEGDSQAHRKVRDILAKALSSQGIKVTTGDADFALKFTIDWQNMEKTGTFYSVAESYLVVLEDGEEQAHFNTKVKAASSYKETAKSNAMTKLAGKLGTQLAQFVVTGKS